jgi:hypothetical protein
VRPLEQTCQVPSREDTRHLIVRRGRDDDSAPFSEPEHRFPQCRRRIEYRQSVGFHHIVHPRDQFATQRAARVKSGEVFAAKTLSLQDGERERVAQRERRRGARCWREVVDALPPSPTHRALLAFACELD